MDSELASTLSFIRNMSLDMLKITYQISIPSQLALPVSFWESYSDNKLAIGLRACLALWAASGKKMIPNEFQLKATIATISGQDSLIDVGTGYGKTLCMILPCLLDPGSISIIISPLKRLQAVQVLEFERYGVKTVSINEDTPNDSELWQGIKEGKFSALLVQPEQLSMVTGHLPHLAQLIAKDHQFRKLIARVHIDEAHFIYTAGLGLYGLPAFRPAWGKLGDFRVKLSKNVVVQALSGTQPEHIKKTIIEHLLFNKENLCSIKLSSNRPNMIYATHPIVGKLSDFRNLDFLVPDQFPPEARLPKTLVFRDNVDECTAAAAYLNDRLSKPLRSKRIVMHYHGGMSKEYLTQVYQDFSEPEGMCKILHATEGASTGLDVPDIEAVIQYGISRDVPTTLQRGGRGGRNKSGQAIFLIMHEPWVKDIDISAIDFTVSDPDHPNVGKLTKTSNKQARTGIAMIKTVQSPECLRNSHAVYLGDKTPDALQHTTPWCCDRHVGSGFQLSQFFKGRLLYQDAQTGDLYYGAPDEPDRTKILPPPKAKRKAQDKQRAPDERKSLVSRLIAWRGNAHANDSLAGVRPLSFIIDDASIMTLAKIQPENIADYRQIRVLLDQTCEWETEWSRKIFEVIQQFDKDLTTLRETTATQKKIRQKRIKVAQDLMSFEQDMKENEQRIRAKVLQQYAAKQQSSNNALQTTNISNVPTLL